MLEQVQWTNKDFDVFKIDGLEQRMEALTSIVRPKFQLLGELFSDYFSVNLGEEFFPHIAKHARRTVNPPKDSWVAFSSYKRGYKSLPHFQIGLWDNYLFIIIAIIYEAPQKTVMANRLLENKEIFNSLPNDFVFSGNHMSQEVISLEVGREEQLEHALEKLRDVKKRDFLVGRYISREEAVQLSPDEFVNLTKDTFDALLPIYKIMVQS
ncbi:YktB family protein [Ureibacillus acetophenoni]|uniref:UPF0637 protein SAMN05877842_101331 n=1 Tax=Ureibacillus acetophenoni TaxID=614649 RepID=A0A285TZU7_9BACL|nr:DUF1054 domain-containing protein [Ureibacillus acetophenoni]SOC35250.1 uncharacterized protein YktB (UPF0637 family) [Ureibacillus acetophenoni]